MVKKTIKNVDFVRCKVNNRGTHRYLCRITNTIETLEGEKREDIFVDVRQINTYNDNIRSSTFFGYSEDELPNFTLNLNNASHCRFEGIKEESPTKYIAHRMVCSR